MNTSAAGKSWQVIGGFFLGGFAAQMTWNLSHRALRGQARAFRLRSSVALVLAREAFLVTVPILPAVLLW
jgi:hypothetical protein